MTSRWDLVWAHADTWGRLSLVALTVAAVVQTTFVLAYVRRPWWRHRVGRAVMLESSALLAALWLTWVDTFWFYADEEKVGAAILGAIAVAVTYQRFALLLTPRDANGNGKG